ncbi:MAG: cytochrome c [Sulfuritalea sp.]|jgi:cytochrome c556|nr:cytochrome c [Sulfuritalea sp.]
MKDLKRAAATAAILAVAICSVPAIAQTPSPQELQRGKDFMQKSMGMMKPELLEKAKALPPEIQQFLLRIAIKHSRHSETLTMRQAMQEILADYQAVAGAIATDNGELAADAARRVADHRLPRGGMLPYLPLEKINGKDLGVLPAMEDAVEGSARRLAAAAEKGDMVAAAQQFGTMTSGCVACHAHFRGQPGVSVLIK